MLSLVMGSETRRILTRPLSKVYADRHTPDEGRREKRSKLCDDNKYEDNSPHVNTVTDKTNTLSYRIQNEA